MTTLFVTDLDGTLLGPDAGVSTRTQHTIERLQDEGVLITCATARSWTTVQRVLGDLRFRLPMVLYNGVFTYDAAAGVLLDQHVLDPATADAVLEVCHEHDLPPLVSSMDADGTEHVSYVVGAENDGMRSFWRDRPHDPRNAPCTTWAGLPTEGVFSIEAIGGAAEVSAVADLIRDAVGDAAAVHAAPDTYHPEEVWLDVAPAGTSKASALELLAARLGADRLVVFGDNVNDLPMFAVADEAYAVGNAVDPVLRAATAVIGRNDEDGVARWLETHAGAVRASHPAGAEHGLEARETSADRPA